MSVPYAQKPISGNCAFCGELWVCDHPGLRGSLPGHIYNIFGSEYAFCSWQHASEWVDANKSSITVPLQRVKEEIEKALRQFEEFARTAETKAQEEGSFSLRLGDGITAETQPLPPAPMRIKLVHEVDAVPFNPPKRRAPVREPEVALQSTSGYGDSTEIRIQKMLGSNPGLANAVIPTLRTRVRPEAQLGIPSYAVDERKSAGELIAWACSNRTSADLLIKVIGEVRPDILRMYP